MVGIFCLFPSRFGSGSRILIWIHGTQWNPEPQTAIHNFCIRRMIAFDPDPQLDSTQICSLVNSLVFSILVRRRGFSFWRRMIFQFRGSESSSASCGIRRISRPTCHRTKCFRKIHTQPHRVYRLSGFLTSRPNWFPPPPHSQASVALPRTQVLWETHSLAGEGVRAQYFHEGTDILELSLCKLYNPSTHSPL